MKARLLLALEQSPWCLWNFVFLEDIRQHMAPPQLADSCQAEVLCTHVLPKVLHRVDISWSVQIYAVEVVNLLEDKRQYLVVEAQ